MADQIEADLETLRREMGQMRTDFAKLSETLQNVVRHGGAEALDKLRHSTDRVKDEIKRGSEGLTHEIEERPVTAALVAFLGGVVLGALFGRRA